MATLTLDKHPGAVKVARVKSKTHEQINNKSVYAHFDKTIPKAQRVQTLELDGTDRFHFVPYLDLADRQRSALFISGPSGSGKSTFANHAIDEYRRIHKNGDKPIVFFSLSKDKDPAFGDKKMFRANFKNKDILQDLVVEKYKDAIVVFDDYEAIADKVLAHYVQTFIKDLLERSRKQRTDIIIINHMTQNYNKTRSIIFECDTYVLFPSANLNATLKFLESYGNMSKKELANLRDIDFDKHEALIFHRSAPRYVLTNQELTLL